MDAATLEEQTKKINEATDRFQVIHPRHIYQLDAMAKGWRQAVRVDRNQHVYFHEAFKRPSGNPYYFDYPIPLPEDKKVRVPDTQGNLNLIAYTTNLRFVDIKITPHIREAYAESHLQVGLNDEHKSHTPRPPWQRIIYHQGYRAGFLALNVPFTDIELSAPEKYRIIAVSRDDAPCLPPTVSVTTSIMKTVLCNLRRGSDTRRTMSKTPVS